MDNHKFACDKVFIDSFRTPTERNLLIATYCNPNFRTVSLPDVYYRLLHENAILLFGGMFLAAVGLVTAINHLAKRAVALPIQEIRNKYQLSSVLASFTLMVLSGFTMVSLNVRSGREGDIHINISQILGTFVFSLTVVLAIMAASSPKDIYLPRAAVKKELGFSLVILGCLVVFSLFSEVNRLSALVLFGLYGAYFLYSIRLAEENKHQEMANELGLPKKLDLDPIKEETAEEHNGSEDARSALMARNGDRSTEKSIAEERGAKESTKREMEFDFGDDLQPDETDSEEEVVVENSATWAKIKDKFRQQKYQGYSGAVCFAVDAFSLATISDSSNPLMDTPWRHGVLSMSILLPLLIFGILPLTTKAILFSFLGAYGGIYFLLKFGLSPKILDFSSDMASILTGVALINLSSLLLVDFLEFVAFYFSMQEILKGSILLAVNSAVSYNFVNQGLVQIGESYLATIGVFAVANFQLVWSLILVILKRCGLWLFDFDLMLLRNHMSLITGEEADEPDRLYARNLVFFVGVVVFGLATFLVRSEFVIGKRFRLYGFGVFGGFLLFSLAHGI